MRMRRMTAVLLDSRSKDTAHVRVATALLKCSLPSLASRTCPRTGVRHISLAALDLGGRFHG